MSKQLTAVAVAKLKSGRARREIRDGAAKGLSLTIQPTGVKSWTMRFRRPDGRPAKLTLGSVDASAREPDGEPVIGAPLTLAGARWLAAEIHRRRATGRDVVADHFAEKQRRRAAVQERANNTFAAAVRDFIDDHARPKTRRWRETARLLGLNYPPTRNEPTEMKGGLVARWSDRAVTEIDGHDIYSVVDEARKRGIPGIGRRNEGVSDARGRAMVRALSKMFAWLVEHRRVSSNPCEGAYCPPAPAARERVLTASEIRWLWSACDTVGEPFGRLVKLLLLTGARLNEVARMTRGELSADDATWALAGTRTKNKRPHVVPLAPLVRKLLTGTPQIVGQSGYVFTTTGEAPVSGFSKAKRQIDAAMLAAAKKEPGGQVSIPSWRLHDLRRTCATGMAELGIAPHIVEAALNHISGARAGVAGTYNRAAYAEEKRTAFERWAMHVLSVADKHWNNVVQLRGST